MIRGSARVTEKCPPSGSPSGHSPRASDVTSPRLSKVTLTAARPDPAQAAGRRTMSKGQTRWSPSGSTGRTSAGLTAPMVSFSR